ncbi:MAG: hypothetical protein KIS67_14590 [Verrucomicrobiae bacterium]|nr:hypothetical protein [Verrucomicrobiae bacterium]
MNIITSILAPVRTAYLLYRWRQRRKAGRSIRVRVAAPVDFFQALDRIGVKYAVMRWWDEVPESPVACATFKGDVDVLVEDHAHVAAARAAAEMHGQVAIEFRSVTGEMGSYAGWPYLPPAFAAEILDKRVRHPRGFFIPAPEHRLAVVMFHLCYHKAEGSGIPTGCELLDANPGQPPKSDYAARLRALAVAEAETLPDPLTLTSIHNRLARRGFDMQLDLLVRWPLQSPWIKHLTSLAKADYAVNAAKLRGIAVFFLRSDLARAQWPRAVAHFAESFEVVEHGALDEAQRLRCRRHLRGGNWFDHRGCSLAEPVYYIICLDRTAFVDPKQATERLLREKRRLREQIRADATAANIRCRHAIHSADDAEEAQHSIDVLFGEEAESARARFFEAISRAATTAPTT